MKFRILGAAVALTVAATAQLSAQADRAAWDKMLDEAIDSGHCTDAAGATGHSLCSEWYYNKCVEVDPVDALKDNFPTAQKWAATCEVMVQEMPGCDHMEAEFFNCNAMGVDF